MKCQYDPLPFLRYMPMGADRATGENKSIRSLVNCPNRALEEIDSRYCMPHTVLYGAWNPKHNDRVLTFIGKGVDFIALGYHNFPPINGVPVLPMWWAKRFN